MKNLTNSKKAASPLFATFFLFFFALSIGLVVMYIITPPQKIEVCDNLDDVFIMETEPYCVLNDEIFFTVKNVGQKTIFGLFIEAVTDQVYIIRDFNVTLTTGEDTFLHYTIPNALNLSRLEIKVYRQSGLDLIRCEQTAIITSSFPEC